MCVCVQVIALSFTPNQIARQCEIRGVGFGKVGWRVCQQLSDCLLVSYVGQTKWLIYQLMCDTNFACAANDGRQISGKSSSDWTWTTTAVCMYVCVYVCVRVVLCAI